MLLTYICRSCGWRQQWTCACKRCGGETDAEPRTGPPLKPGIPTIISDSLPRRMDWQLGQVVDSRAQRRRIMAAKNLETVSASEFRRKYGGLERMGRGYYYAGKKLNKSTAERRQVY